MNGSAISGKGAYLGVAAINNAGQVTGTRIVDGSFHAFITNSSGQMTDLGTLGGDFSTATAINNAGQVTDYSQTTTSPTGHGNAFVTNSSGQMTDLGNDTQGWAINDAGQVTGSVSSVTDGNYNYHAIVINSNGQMTDLGTLGGDRSSGWAINNAGQVTGTAQITDGSDHAFVTDSNGQKTDLGTLGGSQSHGRAINNAGQVAGEAETADGSIHAFVTNSSGQMTDLGTLGDGHYMGVSDINNAGQIVGSFFKAPAAGAFVTNPTASFKYSGAFVTDNGVVKDLNSLVANSAGSTLISANGINDVGQITGTSILNGLIHAFLLTPVASCDANKDGKVNVTDLSIIYTAKNTVNPAYDLDGDGKVTVRDMRICVLKCNNANCQP
ncbi:MAG: HAF repeat-containing protein [Methylococcaceae bacterium]|nr:HAF repeat-containing protein [Methylococcaceae bacterium]